MTLRPRSDKRQGILPYMLKAAEQGEVTSVSSIRQLAPVEAYLSIQRRYAHLFGEHRRPDIVARIQEIADRNIATYGLLSDSGEGAAAPKGKP